MVYCNVLLPLTLFVRKLRRNIAYLFVLSFFVNVGMWLERFVIIVTSLAHDFDPYAWGNPNLSWIAIGITVGSFGMFFTFFLLFVKVLPVLAITEVKEKARMTSPSTARFQVSSFKFEVRSSAFRAKTGTAEKRGLAQERRRHAPSTVPVPASALCRCHSIKRAKRGQSCRTPTPPDSPSFCCPAPSPSLFGVPPSGGMPSVRLSRLPAFR